ITKGLAETSNTDVPTLTELARACDAARAATQSTEKSRADLLDAKTALEKSNANLVARVRELERRMRSFESLVPILKSTLSAKDWTRVQQLCSGDC
ncbi:MAG: hypothetical protein ABI678_32895, partial [Kofleriaceae bacterium]